MTINRHIAQTARSEKSQEHLLRKAVIFDWAGTLSDNFHVFVKVCGDIFKDLGREPISAEEIKQTFTLPYMKFWNAYFPDLSTEKQSKLYRKHIHDGGSPKVFPGAKKLVEDLHLNGFKIFIVSSDISSTLLPELKASGFIDCISEVRGDVYEKEHTLKEIITAYDLNKRETFYVGDTSGDVEAGKKAGVKTIGVASGFQRKDILRKSKPDFVVDDIRELRELLKLD